VQVAPDHDDWTYQPGAPVTFRITVTRDGHAIPGAKVAYGYGPEMLPPRVEKTEAVGKDGLVVAAGTMSEPGFLRLVTGAGRSAPTAAPALAAARPGAAS
jgi:hypothetical protein